MAKLIRLIDWLAVTGKIEASLSNPYNKSILQWVYLIGKLKVKYMKKDVHPNSLANLTYREGRPPVFGSKKKQRTITVTDEGWERFRERIEAAGYKSVSDFIEVCARDGLGVVS